jgi:dihydrolipoamide dehydrogenase
MKHYDLIVIGGGPSGYAAAMRALDFRKSVLLIEREKVGGAGLYNGALSSKTWWELSKEYLMLQSKTSGLGFDLPCPDFVFLRDLVEGAVKERMQLLSRQMDRLSKHNGKALFNAQKGTAKITGNNSVVIHKDGELEEVHCDYMVIACGSRPRKLPHIPVDEHIILTSDGISNLTDWPKSMVILGAGVIGCEFATIFSNFGATKVNLIDKGNHILPFEDQDVVKVIERNLLEKGANIHRDSKLIRMEIKDGQVEYELEHSNGRQEVYRVEKALISVGRVPNHENLWDESVEIKHNERGILDEDTQTSIPNIYAVGDVTADIALVNVGELEGRYAVEKIFGKPNRQLVYENISTIMFFDPEVAGVGLNENQAQKKGIDYKVACLDYACISRAVAMRNTHGFIKILVTNDADMKILGMRVVGEHASSAIQAVALLISMNKGIEELAELIHPHPSIIEGIQECVRMLLGKSMLKPYIMKDQMICRKYENGQYSDIFQYD